jgi:hypothetical protein
MAIHQRYNLTPFCSALVFCQDQQGRDLAVALNRATFVLGANRRPVAGEGDARLVPTEKDVFWGEPASSSMRLVSEIVPSKPGTDIAIIGHAYGRGKRVTEAGFRVGNLEKVLMVQGDRCWVGGHGSAVAGPVPFDKMPLRYELAFGGWYMDEAKRKVAFLANPVGIGFALAAVARAPLPNFEYRGTPITSVNDRPAPAGFGFIPTGWKPRADFAGVFDEAWMETRRPLLPKNCDERFFNAVPQDQVLRTGLKGGERVVLKNLHPRLEMLDFEIPKLAFSARFVVKDRTQEVAMVADTLLIEPDEERFSITFRASCAIDDDVKFLKSVLIDHVEPKP